jgi:hypothetical protein
MSGYAAAFFRNQPQQAIYSILMYHLCYYFNLTQQLRYWRDPCVRQADALLFVYDCGQTCSLEENVWRNVKEYSNKIPLVLIGNKCDANRTTPKVISTEEGREFADKHGMLFFETSAKDDINVDLVSNTCSCVCVCVGGGGGGDILCFLIFVP